MSGRVFAGTAVSGELARASEIASDPTAALDVSCDVYFLDHVPDAALSSATLEASFLSSQAAPIVPVAERMSRSRVGVGDVAAVFMDEEVEARRALAVGELESALPRGTTAEFRVESDERLATVQVSRSLERDELSIELELNVGQEFEALLLQTEFVADGDALLCLVPFEVAPYTDSSLAFMLEARVPEADDDEHVARVERALEEVLAARADVLSAIASLPAEERLRRELAGATSALEVAQLHRSALIFIASRADAALARDISIVGTDEVLAACVRRALDDFHFDDASLDREQRGWRLECACVLVLTDMFARDELTPDLASVLLRRTGEVGRYPGLLEDVLSECGSFSDLEARLIKENSVFLEDRHPSARVRAFDWLMTRELAPEDYDPMASREDRRASLEAWRSARVGDSDE